MFTVVGGPWVSVNEAWYDNLADVLFVGEAEETWLNEGLSHFAEELGGRLVPDAFCPTTNCLTQYVRDDLSNARDYFNSPESYALVESGTSSGTLPERGANWLFVRWLADQSPTDSVLGTDITRRLNGADSPGGLTITGGQNAAAAAVRIKAVRRANSGSRCRS